MTTTPGTGITRDRIIQLTERALGRRIVVVGDVMLDRYVLGETERLSPEAPVPVVHVRESRSALGGVANVAANAKAIGAEVRLVGVVGDDPHGISLRAELAAQQLLDGHLLTVTGRPTTTKTRIVARGQQIVRIDEEIEALLDGPQLERLTHAVRVALDGADALLLEDYNKGALAPTLIRNVIDDARKRGIPVVVDPKYRQFFDYRGATVFKPNRRELEAALGAAVDLESPDALPDALGRLKVDNLLLTLGPAGMVLVTRDRSVIHIPSLAREVFDVSGAGDTVTAWVGTMLAAGASLLEAALLATYAAGIEVSKAGVATVTPEEVIAVHERQHDRLGLLRRGGAI
jgi:D-beta-D-heptose 7-phosphate kinase/D-beta-D-heptose 1-phosphate adenosyltransferase